MISFAGSLYLGSFFEKQEGKRTYQLVYHPERLEAAKVEIGSDLWALRGGNAFRFQTRFLRCQWQTYLEP